MIEKHFNQFVIICDVCYSTVQTDFDSWEEAHDANGDKVFALCEECENA